MSVLQKAHNKSKSTKIIDDKGNWEASFFQRGSSKNQVNEQCVKAECPTGSFDHSRINELMNPRLSREEELLERRNKGIKMTKPENMIVDIYLKKQEQKIINDLEKIKLHGLNAKPQTLEGRIKLLFKIIQYHIDKKTYDMVYYTFNKIKEFNVPINSEYSELVKKIKEIIDDNLDCIELQFNKFHSNMPPLNERGFVQLDPFQKDVIKNINANKSTIVLAPTSAGKSILTGYIYTKANVKAIVVVPTDPLAWQMASMIGKITKKDIPIITRTHQSDITRKGLVEKIKHCGIVVGTPQYLLDYLPLLHEIKFDWVVVDEIHMIGKETCKEMETIIKVYSENPILALSATIGNVDELKEWFIKIGQKDIDIIKCDKRFFNLQKYYYDNKKGLVRIHPFSSVTNDDIKTGNILTLSLNPTPPDVWDLSVKLEEHLPKQLKSHNYFQQEQRITLDQANKYFNELLQWMVSNYKKKGKMIDKLINDYKHTELDKQDFDLYNIAMTLKKEDKTPALIFQTDSHECLELVRKFSRRIRDEEEKAHPNLLKDRLKLESRAKQAEKKDIKINIKDKRGNTVNVSLNTNSMTDKQITKMMQTSEFDKVESSKIDVAIYEPHPDFILNNNQAFSQHTIDQWDKELKYYFPHNGSEYHYIIDLLWRGVGVYCKGLPDSYLHIIQNLACGGKLGLVFSDDSLVFGVSMPFRTTVITPDTNINSMMYHQMAGRAGRRGLDKEGNVVLVGYSWKEIQELTTSCIPNINGCDTMFYGADYGKKLSDNKRWDNAKSNFLLDKITEEDSTDFYDGIKANLEDGWEFAVSDNIAFNHMMWRLRHTDDAFRIAFLLNFIRKIFKNSNANNENTQIEFSKFMANFIAIKETDEDEYVLDPAESASQYKIRGHLETLGLEIPEKIDRKIYDSIRMNKLIETPNHKEKSILRERLLNFGEMIRNIQHYFFHMEERAITRLLGKLLTRIWWIYHSSSPIMDSIERYDASQLVHEEEEDEEEEEEEDEE